MARRPKPWYRRDRRSWFVSLDGVRHNLGPEKKVAFDRFHAMMTRPVKRRLASDAVVVIIDAYLEWCSLHRAADTYAWYRDRLQHFAQAYPELTVRDLTVAILMGHRDPSTLAKVYQHLAHNPQYLLEQARKAVG